MTTKVQEENANPYNQNKSWHKDIEDKQFESSQGMFFKEQPKEPTDTNVEQTVEKEAVEESPKDQPYKKPDYKKRYDDLKKHYDEKVASFKQKEQELRAMAQSSEPTYAPPKSVEDLEQFREQYPDLYETVETVAHLQSEQQVEAIRSKLSAIEEREAAIARREAESALHEQHPDFEDIRGDEKFHNWAETQPEAIQDWIYNNPNNVNLAIKAIDLYKLENGLAKNTKQKSRKSQSSKSAADFVSTKTTGVDSKEPKIWTQREIAALSMRDFDKYEAEIDQAIMEGRVR